MVTFVTIIHVIVCLFLILVILLQAGKGGGMGAAFGGSATQTVFGGRGAATFLSKLTATMAFIFMLTSMLLAFWASQQEDRNLKRRDQAREKAKKAAEANLGQPAKKAGPSKTIPVKSKAPPPEEKKAVPPAPASAPAPAAEEKKAAAEAPAPAAEEKKAAPAAKKVEP
jgi:preprotein translocase subunit SecG